MRGPERGLVALLQCASEPRRKRCAHQNLPIQSLELDRTEAISFQERNDVGFRQLACPDALPCEKRIVTRRLARGEPHHRIAAERVPRTGGPIFPRRMLL